MTTPAGRSVPAIGRLLLFAVAFVTASVVIGVVGYGLVALTPVVPWSRALRIPLAPLVGLAAALAATWLAGRMGDHDAPGVWRRVGLGADAWKARPAAWAAIVAVAALIVPVGLLLATGAVRFDAAATTDSWLTAAWTAFALLVPAAASEELLFRGYGFSVLRDAWGWERALIVTSALFGLLHIFNNQPTVLSIVAVAVAGAFLGVIRIVTGSLVAAFVAHLAFNLAQVVVLHSPVSGYAIQTPGYVLVPVGPAWLTGGDWGPEAGAGVMIALLAATFLTGKRTLWPGTKSSPTPATPP